MNKRNKILVGCLSLLLVLSVGYALFSETVTINGTATAKGDFDIGFECTSTTSTGSATGDCSISGQTITTTSNFKKPSDGNIYTITITNNGSVPAALKTFDSSNVYADDLSVAGDERYKNEYYMIGMYMLNEIQSDSEVVESNIVLQPDDSIVLTIIHTWANSEDFGVSVQPTIPETGATMNYNITLGFEQVTAS